ncbi:MAG: histidine kinase [Gemmatimonadetes bacterium]|nr:histidine kinase [Gemmatimonadota bacterium]
MKLKVAAIVVAVWTLVGLVWGSHMTFEASLQGNPASFRDTSPTAFINALSWIPATLVIVGLTVRFPVRSATWRTHLWVHVLAFPVVAYLTHVFVVLGFWSMGGTFQGLGALAQGALFWTSMRIHIAAVVYVVVAGVTQGLQQFREGQARELRIARLEGQLAKARMDALNAQLRPHFLFNTLHTIGHLWRSGRAEEADALLDHLGSLFERVQATTSEPRVPLGEEIRMVDDYLAIESARFHDRLVVTKSVPPDALSLLVPPLMLQPLIENAIRHGISQSSSAGRISLVASRSNGVLEILVEDDGPGLRADAPTRGTGTGLTNLQQRLEELYGPRGELRVTNRSEGGARVRIRIPAGGEHSDEGLT